MSTGAEPVSAATGARFDDLVHEHRDAVYLRALKLTAGDHAWAEDVRQETFLRAWHHLDRMTAEHGSVRGWLLRVAHNLVVDGYRSHRATYTELTSNLLDTYAEGDTSDRVLYAQVVDDALARLTEGHRAVLEQVYLLDRSVAEAARVLDLPIGTVKSRAFYGLRRLRTLLPSRQSLECT